MRSAIKTTLALLLLSSCSAEPGSEVPTTSRTAALTDGVVYSQFNTFESERHQGGELYGDSIALFGDSLVVGAPGENAIYIYRRQGNKRVFYEAQVIKISDDDTGFGSAVAIADDRTIFVGEPRANVGETRSGRVRVFEFNASTLRWDEAPDLRMMSPQYEAEFGTVVVAQGERVVVGAPDHRRGTDSGSVHSFRKSIAGTWEFEGSLTVPDRSFGRALAIHESRLAVGAQGRTGEGASLMLQGAAYIYEWTTPSGWQQTAKITGIDRYGDAFGDSMALEDDTLAVGVGDGNGHVYVFERNSGGVNTWGEVARFDGAVGSDFGRTLDLDRGFLVVPSQVSDRGVYMYRDNGTGTWEEVEHIDGAGDDFAYNFASAAVIDGSTVIAAEPDRIDVTDPNQPLLSGRIFVYDTNRAPEVTNAEVVVSEDTETEFSFEARDPDETDVLRMEIPDPQHGTIRGTYPRLRYRPDADFFGKDEIEIQVVDQGGLTRIARISFEIYPVNDAPRAEERFTESPITGAELELRATDPEGDEVNFEVVERPSNGVLSGVLPNLLYQPNEGFSGLDTFTYRASDGELWSEPVEYAIYVAEDEVDVVVTVPGKRLDAERGSNVNDEGGCMAAGPGTFSPFAFLLLGFARRRRRRRD